MARKKIYKIKHYKTGYRRKRSGAKKIALFLLGAVAVFIVSFLLLGPLTDLIYNKTVAPDDTSSVSDPIVSSETESAPESTPETVTPEGSSEYKTRTITEEELLAVDKHAELISSIEAEGVGAVIIPVRTNENIYFSTQNDLAIRTKSIVDVKLSELVGTLKEKGIKTIGEFSVFMDNAAPPLKYGTDQVSMGVRFAGNHSYLFLDSVNDPEGTFWLSPNSDIAKEYLLSLATDASKIGLDSVVLTNYRYVKNTNAYFGEEINRSENLKTFLNTLSEAFGDTQITVETDLESIGAGKAEELGGKITDISPSVILSAETLNEDLKQAISSLSETDVTLKIKELTDEEKESLKTISGLEILIG